MESTELWAFFLIDAGLFGTGGFVRDGDDLLLSNETSLPSDVRLAEFVRRKLMSNSSVLNVPEGVTSPVESCCVSVRWFGFGSS